MVLLLAAITVASVLALFPPLIIRAIIDYTLPRGDTAQLNILAVAMVAIVAAASLISVGQAYLANTIGQNIMFGLRRDLYRHLGGMSLRWFTANRTGEVLSRVTNDVGAVQGVISDTMAGIVGNLIVAGTTITLMLRLDWRLTIFSIAFLPVFIFPARRVGNIQRRLVTEQQEQIAKLSGQMHETLSVSGALLVKTFGRATDEEVRFDRTANQVRRLGIRRAMVGRWFNVAIGLAGSIVPAAVYWYGGHQVIGGEASLGTVVAFAALVGRLFGPVSSLLSVNITILSSVSLFERLFDYLDLEHEIDDRPGAVDIPRVEGHVRFDHVGFSYVPGTPVLHDVSFDVPAGQFAALVGASGAGKTTTAYLVPRLYDVESGRVLVDGHDVREITLESLGRSIAMVNQETFLFHESIGDNIRYGRAGATAEEVEEAARAANIHEFIAALPQGYQTVVGERGYRLSGGEKQRLAIARALLKDPRILILDEATSSVDSRTERAIQDALDRLTQGRTTIAIAHRLSTILKADVILVLEQGRVVESGTHQELLARDGTYARQFHQQFEAATPPALAT